MCDDRLATVADTVCAQQEGQSVLRQQHLFNVYIHPMPSFEGMAPAAATETRIATDLSLCTLLQVPVLPRPHTCKPLHSQKRVSLKCTKLMHMHQPAACSCDMPGSNNASIAAHSSE